MGRIGDVVTKHIEDHGTANQLSRGLGSVSAVHGGLAAERRHRPPKLFENKAKNTNPGLKTRPVNRSDQGTSFVVLEPGSDGWNKRSQNGRLRARQSSQEKLQRRKMSAIRACLSCSQRRKQCNEENRCHECLSKGWICVRGAEDIWLWKCPRPISFDKVDDALKIEQLRIQCQEAARTATCSAFRELAQSPWIHRALTKSGFTRFTVLLRKRNDGPGTARALTYELARFIESLSNNSTDGLTEIDESFEACTDIPDAQAIHDSSAPDLQASMRSLQNSFTILSALLHSIVHCRPGPQYFTKGLSTMLIAHFLRRLVISAQNLSKAICITMRKKEAQMVVVRQGICLYYRIICGTQGMPLKAKLIKDLFAEFDESFVRARHNLSGLFDITERCIQPSKSTCAKLARACKKKFTSSASKHSSGTGSSQTAIERFISTQPLEQLDSPSLEVAIFPAPSSTQLGEQAFAHNSIWMVQILQDEDVLSNTLEVFSEKHNETGCFPTDASAARSQPIGPVPLGEIRRASCASYTLKEAASGNPQSRISSQENTLVECDSWGSPTILDEPLSAEPDPESEHETDSGPILCAEFNRPLSSRTRRLGQQIWNHPWDNKCTLKTWPKREYTSGSESSIKPSRRFSPTKKLHIDTELRENLAS